jgi:hypothetical protein
MAEGCDGLANLMFDLSFGSRYFGLILSSCELYELRVIDDVRTEFDAGGVEFANPGPGEAGTTDRGSRVEGRGLMTTDH